MPTHTNANANAAAFGVDDAKLEELGFIKAETIQQIIQKINSTKKISTRDHVMAGEKKHRISRFAMKDGILHAWVNQTRTEKRRLLRVVELENGAKTLCELGVVCAMEHAKTKKESARKPLPKKVFESFLSKTVDLPAREVLKTKIFDHILEHMKEWDGKKGKKCNGTGSLPCLHPPFCY
jgi:hypothetical protein